VGPVRESHEAPAAWHPVPPRPERDDFDAAGLAPYWISPRRRPAGSWSLDERPGALTLHATGDSLDRPGHTFVGRRQQHPECRVDALLEPGNGRAGLSVRIDEAHHYDLEIAGGEARVIARIGPARSCVARRAVAAGPLALSIGVRTEPLVSATGEDLQGLRAGGPDAITFAVDGEPLAALDGRYLSTQVGGGFTGRVIGMYVTEGSAAFDWFTYAAEPPR
jgi:hypothetical protein